MVMKASVFMALKAISHVAMRRKDSGKSARPGRGSVEVPGYVVAGYGLEVHLFHRVIAALNPAVDHGVKAGSRRKRVEPACHLELDAQVPGAKLPLLQILSGFAKGEIEVKAVTGVQATQDEVEEGLFGEG